MKNVLVTGGAGFIGSNFIRMLLDLEPSISIWNLDALTYAADTNNIRFPNHTPNCNFIRGYIEDRGLVEDILVRYNIDTVVNFAAETHVDNSITNATPFMESNIFGVYNLLDVIKKVNKNIHFHQVSTDEVFGELQPGEEAWTENSPYKPNSPYAASKAAADHLVRSFGRTYGLRYTISHCTNNYGPRQHTEKFIPKIITNAFLGKPIPVYGEGLQERDWIFVDDHCYGIYLILKKEITNQTFNFGFGNTVTNISLVKDICDIMDGLYPTRQPYSNLITFVEDRKGHDMRYCLNTTKAARVLAWGTSKPLYSGLLETIHWYKRKLA